MRKTALWAVLFCSLLVGAPNTCKAQSSTPVSRLSLFDPCVEDVNRLPDGRQLRVVPCIVVDWLTLFLDRTAAQPVRVTFQIENGKTMKEVWLQDEYLFDTSHWPEGAYLYQIFDAEGRCLGRGRIEVLRSPDHRRLYPG